VFDDIVDDIDNKSNRSDISPNESEDSSEFSEVEIGRLLQPCLDKKATNIKNLKRILQEIDEIEDDDPGHFLKNEEEIEIGEAGPGPSTIASKQLNQNSIAPKEEENQQVFIDYPGSGKVSRLDQQIHQRWRHLSHANTIKDTTNININPFAPFTSEMEWRIARWAVKDGIGHKSFDRLLSIPGVCIPYNLLVDIYSYAHRSKTNWVYCTAIYMPCIKLSTMKYLIVEDHGRWRSYSSKICLTWHIQYGIRILLRLSKAYGVILHCLPVYPIVCKRSLPHQQNMKECIQSFGQGSGGMQFRCINILLSNFVF